MTPLSGCVASLVAACAWAADLSVRVGLACTVLCIGQFVAIFDKVSHALNAGVGRLPRRKDRRSMVEFAGIRSQTKKLHFHKPSWRSVCGQPTNTIKIRGKPAHKASGKSKHGGVAILAKDPIALVPVGYDTFQGHALSETTRWTTAAIPLSPCGALSRRFLHIVSFYGIPNRLNSAEYTQNERLIELVFQHCNSLGPQPVLLCMDCNTSPEKVCSFKNR